MLPVFFRDELSIFLAREEVCDAVSLPFDVRTLRSLAILFLYYTIYVCVPTTVQVSAAEQIVNTPLSSTISPTSHVAGSVLYLGTFNSVLNRDALLKS